jgi:hypothetical protein
MEFVQRTEQLFLPRPGRMIWHPSAEERVKTLLMFSIN